MVATLAILFAVLSVSVGTLCWFANNSVNFPTDFGGSAETAYFGGGDGSADNPYIINNKVHLYNLAWLQYLGYFNMRSDLNDGKSQTYFKLTADIDMDGLSIPPIGTEQYPFVGNFDGNHHTIRCVNISNRENDLTIRPTDAKFDGTGDDALLTTIETDESNRSEVSIVGLFGVVGDYSDYVSGDGGYSAIYTDFDAGKITLQNFYVDKIHVTSGSGATLVGLTAGYVSANLSNIGIYRSDITLTAGTTEGSTLADGAISYYALVGNKSAKTKATDWGSSDDGNDWGGSIDMRTLARRVNYMMATSENAYYQYVHIATFRNDNYHLYASSQRVKNYIFEYGYNPNGSQSLGTDANLLGGSYKTSSSTTESLYTVLPINVNKSAMGLDSDDETETVSRTVYKYNGSFNTGFDVFYPTSTKTNATFKLNTEYKNATSETVSNNTGYIVGLGTTTKTSAVQGAIQINVRLRSSSSSVKNSFNGTSYGASTFALITYCGVGDSGFCFIKDSYNTTDSGYTGPTGLGQVTLSEATYLNKEADGTYHYEKVRSDSNFERYMGIGDGNTNIYGLSFNSQYGFGINNASTVISYDGENGTEKLVTGAINFNVQDAGIITAIVGTYYGSDVEQNAFTLYKVDKEGLTVGSSASSGGLTTVNQIYEYNGEYYINENPNDSGTLRYDRTWYAKGKKNGNIPCNYACYIEIPVPAGDYVIGYDGVDTTCRNGYLMYLDIGANGSGSGSGSSTSYTISGVQFVNTDTVTNETYPTYTAVTFKLTDATGEVKTVLFERKGEVDELDTAVAYQSTGITATPNPTAKAEETTIQKSTHTDDETGNTG